MYRAVMWIVLCNMLVGCTTGGTKMRSSWKDPQLAVPASGRVVVLADVDEPGTRRALEDETVSELRERGVQAFPAYSALPETLAGDSAARAKAQEAGYGLLMLYQMGGNYTDIANQPGLGAGVGFGMFGISLGPLVGGSKAEQRGAITVQLFPTTAVQPIWSAQYDVNLSEGVRAGLKDVPEAAASQARNDRAL